VTYHPNEPKPSAPVIWLTGLPASGKTTIANELERQIARGGTRVEVLDGDVLRQTLCRELGYSRADRDENIRRIGFVTHLLAKHGVTTIVAAVSPYRRARDQIRATVRCFIEVHLRCPLEVLECRDPKRLYQRARLGELKGLTGLDDPYEEPLEPELVVDTSSEDVGASVQRILGYLNVVQRCPR
jgi:adenylylsulfate kinase